MKEFTVDAQNNGKKIFRYVQDILPGLKNGEIFKLIRKKIVTVNDKKIEPDLVLNAADLVKIFLSDFHFAKKGKEIKTKFYSVKKKIDILYEDESIIVLNKESGVLIHPDKNEYKNTLIENVKAYLYGKNEYDPKNIFSPSPCNRLDKNTSGIVVVAKNQTSLALINRKFSERNVVKTYRGVVCGRIEKKIFLSSELIISDNGVRIKDFDAGYKVPDKLKYLSDNPLRSATILTPIRSNDDLTYVEIDLWTGKKHQIRAHLAFYGCGFLGDRKYFNSASQKLLQSYLIEKYLLHSHRLKIDGYPEWTAPLPVFFEEFITQHFK